MITFKNTHKNYKLNYNSSSIVNIFFFYLIIESILILWVWACNILNTVATLYVILFSEKIFKNYIS